MKTKQYPIALNLPTVVALLIVYGRHIVQMMTNNAWFPTTDPDLGTVGKHLDSLEKAEAQAKGKGLGLAEVRDLAGKLVVSDLMRLMWCVSIVVSQNPGQEAAIIASAGMKQKRYTRPNKPELEAFMGLILTQAEVVATAVPKAGAYEWQYSTNNGQTWVNMPVTTVAHTSLPGVVMGTTYLFRFRTTRRDVATDWSAAVSLTVK